MLSSRAASACFASGSSCRVPLLHTPQQKSCSSRSASRCACSSDAAQEVGSDSTHPALPPLPSGQQQALARRNVLALVAAAAAAAAPAATPAASQAAAAAPAPAVPVTPVPVPPLTETYVSSEGFAFDYPEGWVVAFDRSGSSGNGAVVVVGDFRKLITVSVFRTVTIAEETVRQGLTEEAGYAICVEPQQRQDSTMRFNLIRSGLAPPAPGASAPGSPGGAGGPAFEYEFSLESCAGEIEEGMGGRLRCLSFGAVVPSQRRRSVGRAVLANGRAYSLNATCPEDKWEQIGPLVQAVVSTFRS